MAIEQSILIRAKFDGLGEMRKAKSDIEDLKKTAESVGEAGGKEISTDIKSVSALRKQTNLVRQMNTITNKMMRDMKRGDFIGTTSYVKNLDKSIKKLEKMSDVVDDMGDSQQKQDRQSRSMGAGGMVQGTVGRFQSIAGALAGRDVVSGGMVAISQTGAGMQQVGKEAGGGTGAMLAGAGLAGIITGGLLMGLSGIDKLIYGAFEDVAPKLYGFERAMGRDITTRKDGGKSVYQEIREMSERALLDRADVISAMNVIRMTSGGRGVNAANVIDIMRTGVSPELAGEIFGMEKKYGGDMTGAGFRQMATQGGYGQRIDIFAQGVKQMTQSLQDMGIDIGSKAGAEIISELGMYGKKFRGTAGFRVGMGVTGAMQAATGLETPEAAMLYRAIGKGRTYRETMLSMEQGVMGRDEKGVSNLERMIEYVKSITVDENARARILRKLSKGTISFSSAYDLLSGKIAPDELSPKEEERRKRGEVGITEAGRTIRAQLPLEIKSETGYVNIARGIVRTVAEEGGRRESEKQYMGRVLSREEVMEATRGMTEEQMRGFLGRQAMSLSFFQKMGVAHEEVFGKKDINININNNSNSKVTVKAKR